MHFRDLVNSQLKGSLSANCISYSPPPDHVSSPWKRLDFTEIRADVTDLMVTSCFSREDTEADEWINAVTHCFSLLVTQNISCLTEHTHCVSITEKNCRIMDVVKFGNTFY